MTIEPSVSQPCPVAAPDEAALLQGLRDGDPDAFARLVRTYGPRLLAAARRLLPNDQDAEDALQEAFLGAFRALDRFEGQSQLATWLHRITVNAALMKLRAKKRRPETPIEDLLPRFLADGHRVDAAGRWSLAVDTSVDDRELRSVVRDCIDRLPEGYRTVLVLRDIEELSTAETAHALGMEPGAVKTRLHRARQALRTLLDPYMRGEPVSPRVPR